MSKIQKVLVTGKTHTTGSDARIFSGDHEGNLNIKLTGTGARSYAFEAIQAHPTAEQLFAGAWSACYSGAVGIVAKEKNVTLPADTAVDIEVDLGLSGSEYLLQARITLIAPGVDEEVALAIAHGADQMCPYSKATRGNIDVALKVVTA
ncbi:Ohr family peroxiredoxin [Undibacterium terreum]|uniref:Peroxiredoxin n=1 Tax=Undibacterium terreum TaxID=1224302 RepID=A0A916XR20_9BURK|nr:Ohr family peroxiredoxin [Undibacterium terreum]GGC97955.1 peroxiredoxin [Undibacterium terreum]